MEIQYSTQAICKVKYKRNTKSEANSETSLDTCRICNIYFQQLQSAISGSKTSTFPQNLFKIPKRAGVASIPLADLLKPILELKWIHKMGNPDQ